MRAKIKGSKFYPLLTYKDQYKCYAIKKTSRYSICVPHTSIAKNEQLHLYTNIAHIGQRQFLNVRPPELIISKHIQMKNSPLKKGTEISAPWIDSTAQHKESIAEITD